MRTLFLMRGLPGSGKSTFIQEHNLEKYTLSTDHLRELYGSNVLAIDGSNTISQKANSFVFKTLLQMLEYRMKIGAMTIIDATNIKGSDVANYRKLAEKYRYRVFVIDFTDVPLEECIRRNHNREAYKRVPDTSIEKMHISLQSAKIPSSFKVIKPENFCFENDEIFFHCRDFNKYSTITIVGDIHGCYEPLKELFKDGIKEDEMYIFCGDYLDRGIQNVEVLNFLMRLPKENTIFLEGNHECHLNAWAHSEKSNSPEFEENTSKQLDAAGLSKSDVRQFCRRFSQAAYFEFYGKRFSVTHGGLPCVPNTFINTEQMIKGVGYYSESEDVDGTFYDKEGPGYYTVHGHRNVNGVPIVANDRAFNLEGKVEFGGYLRAIRITPDEIIPIEIKNDVFRPFDYGEINKPIPCDDIPAVIEAMRSTELVREKKFGHISSFNFTRNAFENASWSDVTIKARGLFINTHTNKVVARGYEKFFKIGERPETKLEALKENLVFPLTAMVKENGFLGVLGYDEEKDELLFCSKSMIEGQYAEYFKNVFLNTVNSNKLEDIKAYLRDNNKAMVFEVIDVENDPHIIEYSQNKVVLLDILDRKVEFSRLPFEELLEFALKFGFECKMKDKVLNNWQDFLSWYEEVTSPDFQFDIEGFVVEDSNGFMFKTKTYYYDHWKFMRGVVDSVFKYGHYRNTSKFASELDNHFYKWVLDNRSELEGLDIIQIRKRYFL